VIQDVNCTLAEIVSWSEAQLAFLWGEFTPQEQAVLFALTRLRSMGELGTRGAIAGPLMEHGLHLAPAAISEGARRLFRREAWQQHASCAGIGQERDTTSRNGMHPGITLRPGTRARPKVHKETGESWIPLERCLGTATLATPCLFRQTHGNLIAQTNRLAAAGAAPQVFPC
jgi:hypothetical protein